MNYLGRCEVCKVVICKDNYIKTECPNGCKNQFGITNDIYFKEVKGKFKENMICDDRCRYAVGCSCTCSCGGKNHGIGWSQSEINLQEKAVADDRLSYNLNLMKHLEYGGIA